MNNYSKIIKPNVNQLIDDNTNLVKKISWYLHGRVNSIVDIEDIIQIGMLGLISAAQNYTPQKNASFVSYASIRIKGEILDYLRKSSNLDRTTISIKKNSEKAINHLRNKLGREPYQNAAGEGGQGVWRQVEAAALRLWQGEAAREAKED